MMIIEDVVMLSLSQSTGYAIKALAYVSAHNNSPRQIHDISSSAGIPAPYLAKIVRRLSNAGIVHAKRGYKGGVSLNRPADRITLLDIGEAIEGEDLVGDCLLGRTFCGDLPTCPTWRFWRGVRKRIEAELARMTLADIIAFNRKHARRASRQTRKGARE